MPKLIAVLLSITSTLSFVFGEENIALTKLLEERGAEIKKALDKDKWEIEVRADSIVVESKFEAAAYNMVSAYDGMKPIHERYRIELKFKNRLGKKEYVELTKKRAEALAVVNYGAETKDDYSSAGRFLRANPLPRYESMDENGKQYSVYVGNYDSPNVKIIPASGYAQGKAAEALIDQLFNRLMQ